MNKIKSHLRLNLKMLITAISVVMVWRSVWGVLDHYFLPKHKGLSYLAAFVIGISVLLLDDWLLGELDDKL